MRFQELALIVKADNWRPHGATDRRHRTPDMRKPRNYDEDLKALTAKAKQLKARKQSQLGELVEATGADALPIEELAGALLSIAAITDQRDGRHGANAAPRSFLASGPNRRLAEALATTRNQQRRTTSARHRLALQQARHDTRAWQVKRRAHAAVDRTGWAHCQGRPCRTDR
jgi:hypothetical protein